MKKLSKVEMKRLRGGESARATCGQDCFYAVGNYLVKSTCTLFLDYPIPPGGIPHAQCLCRATGKSCYTIGVVNPD